MKKYRFSVWMFCLLAGILVFTGFSGYVIHHSTDSKEWLVTLQGTPSDLEGVTLGLTTSLSQNRDFLHSKIALGDTLTTNSSFTSGLGEPDRSIYSESSEYPYISNQKVFYEKNLGTTLPYTEFSKTIPFTLSTGSNQKTMNFPYLTMDAPEDLTLTYEPDNKCYDSNYDIPVDATNFAVLDGKKYFSIFFTEETPAYTLDGVIFRYDGSAITKVYGGIADETTSSNIIRLLSIDALHCLGLVVKEDGRYLLKLIDPVTGKLLADQELAKADSLDMDFKVSYNASCNCLLVTTNQIDCYTFDGPVHLNLAVSYDWAAVRSDLKCPYTDSPYFSDFVYKDNVLYLVDSMEYVLGIESPHLIALKKDAPLYEGYLMTNATEDYSSNRNAVTAYEGDHDSSSYYHSYSRETGHFTLSTIN